MNLFAVVKNYFSETTIHGLRYISESGSHFTEKLFWTAVCLSSVFGTWRLFQASLNSYNHNAIGFTAETTHLDWNTTFPAVSVCEVADEDKLSAFANISVKENHRKPFPVSGYFSVTADTRYRRDPSGTRDRNLDLFYRDVIFFSGTCNICGTHCGTRSACPTNFTELVDAVRASCRFLLSNCSWGDEDFDCCAPNKFQPLETELGICFTINSQQVNKYGGNTEKLLSNRISGPGKLQFHVHEDVTVHIHSPEDVPYVNEQKYGYMKVSWGSLANMMFQVTEIDNDPLLDEVSIEERHCRFPHENNLVVYPLYSYSACVVQCHADHQMDKCNCRHHLMPNQREDLNTTCTIKGLNCLTKYAVELNRLRHDWDSISGLVCSCESSCTEPEYRVVHKHVSPLDEPESSIVTIKMQSLPSVRFKRNVVRTRLDLVVSLGGAAGLFLGASLLSIVELFYFWFIRTCNYNQSNDRTTGAAPKLKVTKIGE